MSTFSRDVVPFLILLFHCNQIDCLDDTNYVCCGNAYYKQKDGLTIGGSVSAILADIVITDLFDDVVNNSGFDPTLLVKYVDDTLMIIPREELEIFFNSLNEYNNSIQFTMEIEENNKIPYLDILIHRTPRGIIETAIYQKPTSKNRLLNYESAHPSSQKTGVAYGLISRYMSLCSEAYKEETTSKIFNVLQSNGYPRELIKHLINKFDNKNAEINTRTRCNFRGLTYTQHLSENIRNLLIKFDDKLEIGYKTKTTTRRILPNLYPCRPTMEKHEVVYKIQCKNCPGEYIGQTGQKLQSRINQHKYDSTSTSDQMKLTAAAQHVRELNHQFDYNETTILGTEQHLAKRLTLESINIYLRRKTSINLRSDLDNLNPVYCQLLRGEKS